MKIEYDPVKRAETLRLRGIDMADAVFVFEDEILTVVDDRIVYGEQRFVTVGRMRGRMMFVAWTLRGDTRRTIRIRKANGREIARYQD